MHPAGFRLESRSVRAGITGFATSAPTDAARTMGCFDPDVVAVEARRSMITTIPAPTPVPLPATATAAITRPLPSLADYDQLPKAATA